MAEISKNSHRESARLATKVAFYYHEIGMSQIEICNHFALSQARVSRLLKYANTAGIVNTVVEIPKGVHIDLERKLEEAFGLIDVVIFDNENPDNAKTTLAQDAAIFLEATLSSEDKIGIASWSATLLETVEEMKARPHKVVQRVVQLIGGVGQQDAQVHASRLVSRFAAVVSAEPIYLNLPGVVSASSSIANYTDEISDITKVWQDLTCAITGIGPIPHSDLLQLSGNSLDNIGLSELLNKGVVGEVCLRFFDTWGKHLESKFEENVISIKAEQLRKIPRRIGIAAGDHKVKAIKGAIQGKWVNILITDLTTAKKLLP